MFEPQVGLIQDIMIFSGALLESRFSSNIEVKLKGILQLSLRLRELIGQGVTSNDFQVICPRYKSEFDKTLMDDAFATNDAKYGDSEGSASSVILTTDLGLRRRERMKGTANAQGYIQQVVPLKAKVFLRSSVSELVGGGDVEMRGT